MRKFELELAGVPMKLRNEVSVCLEKNKCRAKILAVRSIELSCSKLFAVYVEDYILRIFKCKVSDTGLVSDVEAIFLTHGDIEIFVKYGQEMGLNS